MKKEVMICDRCGKEIKNYISKFKHLSIENFSRPYRRVETISTEIAERCYATPFLIPNIESMEIRECYGPKRKEYNLCHDCRKAFERFMKNEY